MSALLQRRQRIARVRRVQHIHAAADAALAEGKAMSLQSTSDRLGQLRQTLTPTVGAVYGGAFANAAELATRLERVRDDLTDAIVSAKQTALERAALRIEARIRQESAERLQDRALAALAAEAERRLQALRPRRRSGDKGDDE